MQVKVNVVLTFPVGTTQTRAREIAVQIADGIQNDLDQAGSDMFPGSVPSVEVQK